jgi:hypothetical protein
MATRSFYYVVPHVRLIPQDKDNACWYASAQMLIQWKRDQTQSTSGPDPSELPSTSALYKQDQGISDQRIVQLAKELGLVRVPPMSPTYEAVCQWLGRYGPLWVNGIGHITVIAGIDVSPSRASFLVYDPLPKNKGSIEWRDIQKWYTGVNWPVSGGGFEASGRDTTTNAGIFLYVPN